MVVSCEKEEDTENDTESCRIGDDPLLWIIAGEEEYGEKKDLFSQSCLIGLLSFEESAGVIVDGASRTSGAGNWVRICGCAERWR